MNKKKDKSKKRVVVVNKNGQAHIKCSFNNIIISLTNESGQVISWSSAGKMGFRGSKKNTPFAAQIATEDAVKKACLLYTSPSPRDATLSRMPSSA